MKKITIIIFSTMFILAGLITVKYIVNTPIHQPMNTVYLNELVKLTQQNWEHLSIGTYPDGTYDFRVIDLTGQVLFSTYAVKNGSYDQQINEAIGNRDVIIDITRDGSMVGKLIVKNDVFDIMGSERNRLIRVLILLMSASLLTVLGANLYLEIRMIRPFRRMEEFARSIATGDLNLPVQMDKGNIFGAFTESFDLMRDALKAARHNEYLANKSKKELVASLSHDIKNPVASIKAMCETMALYSKDKYVSVIHKKAELIDSLISDMFQSTLEDLGELKVIPEEYSSEILYEMIHHINYYDRIKIISPLPGCLILCDRLRLTQVIDNVVSNSYKYADTPIHISFGLEISNLTIQIKDFGEGAAEDELPFLWEKFYRGKNSAGKEGAGLGLYLSNQFMKKMGGADGVPE